MSMLARLTTLWPKIAAGLAVSTVLAASGCAVQTARLKAERTEKGYLVARIKDIADVQDQQNERLISWAKAIETKSQRIADSADKAFESGRQAASDAVDRYIATHRLQPAKGGGSAFELAPSAEAGSAGVSVEMPADAVVVSAVDVQACSAAADYALRAHDWAVEEAEEQFAENAQK